MNEIKEYSEKIFEDIKHIDEFGHEYWLARELQKILGYHQWRSINDLIERAIVACQVSKYNVDDHFAVQRKMIKLAKGSTRKVVDYKLSRYACYLIVMNGNPKKEIILLCHELPGLDINKEHFCHRRLLADWIELETGIVIPEISIDKTGIITQEKIYDLKQRIKKNKKLKNKT